ncbi:MAG: SpoIIE family protein phosphatase [Nitriliruptorales bacterium]|nr:SpoIIE family protein phosphatase [Nitriliruptorales bacterium]
MPQLADWCAVYLLHESDEIRLAASDAADERLGAVMRDLVRRLMYRLDQSHGVGTVIRTGRSELARQVPDAVLRGLANDKVSLEELRKAPATTGIVVPLPARGRTLGALTLTRADGPPYSASELEFAEDLARRAALAVDNALRYAFERDAAATLQRSLLPRDLPATSTVRTAARYLPGASGTEIGGDWYDLIDLGDGRLGLVVGDVMGRGIPAAAVMGQVRTALRAYAYDGHEPADLLRRLDRVVQALGEVQLTTCIYGVFDPASRSGCAGLPGSPRARRTSCATRCCGHLAATATTTTRRCWRSP